MKNLFRNINLHDDDEFQYHPLTTTDVKFIASKDLQIEHPFADLFGSIELQIVRGCGGFPLALEVVGKSLKGESEVTWNNRLNRWSEGQSIFYSDAAPNGATDLLNRLQTTLDDLDVKIKECYLDLAAFPEDQRIPAMALVDMWVELYNLDEVSAFANIHELSDRNLLNLVPTRYCFLLRDVLYVGVCARLLVR